MMAGKTAELVGTVIPLNGSPRYDPNLYETHTLVREKDGVPYVAQPVYVRTVSLLVGT